MRQEGRQCGKKTIGRPFRPGVTQVTAAPGEEPRIIKDSLAIIERAVGARPRGWLGSGLQETWDTLDLLVAEGCDYVCDWTNDDQPYIMKLDGGKTLVSVPYSHEINDKPAFERFNRTADEFREMICRQFDVLYREGAELGRVMAIAITPCAKASMRMRDAGEIGVSARLHQPARARVESDRHGDCDALSRPSRQTIKSRPMSARE